jgi:hypothetical protein
MRTPRGQARAGMIHARRREHCASTGNPRELVGGRPQAGTYSTRFLEDMGEMDPDSFRGGGSKGIWVDGKGFGLRGQGSGAR